MYQSFIPPNRTLMGPGPSDVYPEILAAMARPTIGHLDPEFIRLMDETRALLQYAFVTENRLTIAVSAPGSAGMEACFVNLVEAGDKVIVCQNGVFGGRMQENVERCGGEAIMVHDTWGEAIDLDKVESAFKQNPDAKILAFVHAETSTGALSNAKELCALAQKYGALTIVDAVTSLGGNELLVDAWGIDAVYSGTQKCLSCVPGLSPVSFSARAIEHIGKRQRKAQSWFLDMDLVMGYWGETGQTGGKRAYHHTAPINACYALHEALLLLKQEGLENAWARHQHHHLALAAGLEVLGMQFVVEKTARLPQLNSVYIPAGVDDAQIRNHLLTAYNLEIGAGLGALAGKVWRIGLMGHSCREANVINCLNALESSLIEVGKQSLTQGKAAKAAQDFYQSTSFE